MKKLIFAAALLAGGQARGADVDLTKELLRRNEIYRVTQDIHPYLYDQQVMGRLDAWVHHYKINDYMVDCQFHLRAFFRSERVIAPLCYFLRQDDAAKREQYFAFVKRYVLEVHAALVELAHDPRYSSGDQGKAAGWAHTFDSASDDKLKQCFSAALTAQYPADGSLPYAPFSAVGKCFQQTLPKIGGGPYFAVNLAKEFPHHPGHAISDTGWVGGNKVLYLTHNDTSEEVAEKLAAAHDRLKELYPLNGAGSYEAMRDKDPKDVFTAEQGFVTIDQHPVWNEQGSIFEGMHDFFKEAKESIFIDMFFIGSSMGVALAKYLMQRADEGVKVMVLRDNYNHLGHEKEMLPVYNYLKAYAYHHPDRMVVSASYIKGHQSGLPKFAQGMISDEFIKMSGLQSHLMVYGRAESDHSKVFVVDGKSDHPKAMVGSKNLTDASGAVTYDEVLRIDGPGAAVVLDDFYLDMSQALQKEMEPDFLEHLAKEGWSKSSYASGQSAAEMAAHVLEPFDLLGRDGELNVKSGAEVSIPAQGNVVLRTGYNSVDSSRSNCVDQDIQMALAAKHRIYIKDQYLFDRNVVLALLKAKKANPSLEIKAILEPLHRANPRGMPNLLYLDKLKAAGIEVRWKKIMEPHGSVVSEYHMKTMSADGESLITGSANKDQTTMYGAFREEQVDVFDAAAVKAHDDVFAQHWTDEESEPFVSFAFEVPHGLKGLNGQPLDPNQFVALLRNVVSILFDTTRL